MAKKKDKGWVKVYRQITDSYIWTAKDPFDRRSAWIDLIIMANHEERSFLLRNGQNQVVGEGQLFTSLDNLAERWHWSRNRVRRYLALISAHGMCKVTGTPSGTLITLIKYGDFQHGRHTDRHTDGQANGQTDGQTDGQRTRTNIQELSNNKNGKQEGAAAPDVPSGRYELE